jgi:sulfonate transport system substrate-binding protein
LFSNVKSVKLNYVEGKQIMKKRMIPVLTLVLISVLMLGAYGFTAGLTKLKLSHHPYIHALPSYVAEKRGWYKAAGYDTTITMFAGGPPQNEALASDAWEVGTTGSGGAILGGIGYNLHVIGFSASDNLTDIWVRPNSPIAKKKGYVKSNPDIYGTPKQWKGSTVICPSGTSCHMILMGTLKKLGLSEKDIKLVDMPVAQGFPAFKAGQADIVALWSPFGFLAEAAGWVKVSSADAIDVTLPTLIVASDKAIKNRRDDVRKWFSIYMKGVDYVQKDSKRAAKLLFNLEKENGIKLSEKDSLLEVTHRPFANMKEQVKLFKKEPGKTYCRAEEIIYQFVDYLISQGRIEPKDKQRLIDNKFVDGSIIESLAK